MDNLESKDNSFRQNINTNNINTSVSTTNTTTSSIIKPKPVSNIKNINVESTNVLEKSVLDYLDGKLIGNDDNKSIKITKTIVDNKLIKKTDLKLKDNISKFNSDDNINNNINKGKKLSTNIEKIKEDRI